MNKQLLLGALLFVISYSYLQNMRIDTTNTRLNIESATSTSLTSSTVGAPTRPFTLQPNSYPIRAVYIDSIHSHTQSDIAYDLGIPGAAQENNYNYVILSEWTCSLQAVKAARMWLDVVNYFGQTGTYGRTTREIQGNIRKKFNQQGIKLLVSAFRSEQAPTTLNLDPTECAHQLGHFVLDNQLDGAQVDWQDNIALETGTGEQWLITFTIELRNIIPNHIVSHGPKASYFRKQTYQDKGYFAVNEAVGDMINFYSVKFYNHEDTQFNTYQDLFLQSIGSYSGCSVKEIADRGIPLNKIVISKPLTVSNGVITGWVEISELGAWTQKAYEELGWYAGLSIWERCWDHSGSEINLATEILIIKCSINKNCK